MKVLKCHHFCPGLPSSSPANMKVGGNSSAPFTPSVAGKKSNNSNSNQEQSKGGGGGSGSKGFNSWASISKPGGSSSSKPLVTKDTFADFKKKAKDKEDKQKLLMEQQEQRRLQKEAAERERQRQEKERQREREEEEALERMRRGSSAAILDDIIKSESTSLVGSPSPSSQGSNSPAHGMSDRERQRRMEQERRRREAVSYFIFPFTIARLLFI